MTAKPRECDLVRLNLLSAAALPLACSVSWGAPASPARLAMLDAVMPLLSKIAAAPADASKAEESIRKLARTLDFEYPRSVNNSMTLAPLLRELEREPRQDERALTSALERTQASVNEDARAIALALRERRLNPYKHGLLVELAYRRARQIAWYERVYLTPENDKLFEQAWLGPHGLQTTYGKLLNTSRVSRQVEEEMPVAWSIHGGSALEDDSDFEFLEDQPARVSTWSDFIFRLLGRDSDIDPPDREKVRKLRDRFWAERGPKDAQRTQYPLNVTKLLYLDKLKENAASGDISGFDSFVRFIYLRMDIEIRHHIFPYLRKIGRLGPRSRELLEALRGQNASLLALIDGMDPRKGYAWEIRDTSNLHGALNALIEKTERKFARREEKTKRAAQLASKRLLARLRDDKYNGKTVRCFVAIVDYYTRLLLSAQKDIQDPDHKQEFLRLIRYGDETAPSIPPIAELKKHWVRFSKKSNHMVWLCAKAGLLTFLAVTIAWGAPLWLQKITGTTLIVLMAAEIAASLIAWLSISSWARAQSLGTKINALFRIRI